MGLTFAIDTYDITPYAFLDPGVQAKHVLNYAIRGVSSQHSPRTTKISGPYDDVVKIHEDFRGEDQTWSPCDRDPELYLITRMMVTNGTPRGTGYINITYLTYEAKAVVGLRWRKCGD